MISEQQKAEGILDFQFFSSRKYFFVKCFYCPTINRILSSN